MRTESREPLPDTVLVQDLTDGVLTLTLNRPARLNSLDWRLLDALITTFREVNARDEVRCIVITGNGNGFCSGADLQGTPDDPEPEPDRQLRTAPLGRFGLIAIAQGDVRKPMIAAVNGVAAGAGFSLALGCDIRIASDAARFTTVFIRRGLAPDGGASYYLPRLIGTGRALELLLTGDMVSAAEADRIGLVNRVVPAASLMDEVQTLARRIAAGPPLALELTKRVTLKGLAVNDLETQVSYETWAQGIAMASEDADEGAKAFLERRPPVFRGR